MRLSNREFWEAKWGRDYRPVKKSFTVRRLCQQMQDENALGEVILDVGSGALIQSHDAPGYRNQRHVALYYPRRGKKIIQIDPGAPQKVSRVSNVLTLKEDIHDFLARDGSKRGLSGHVANFLGLKPPFALHTSRPVDTTILSDVVGYLDYRKVIRGLKHLLKPNGRVVVYHSTGVAFEGMEHPRRPKNIPELLQSFQNSGFQIEQAVTPTVDWQDYPWVEPVSRLERRDSILMVARLGH